MDRREFLKRTATAAAIAAVVPSALIAAAKPSLFAGKQAVIGVDWGAGDDQTVIRTLVWGKERIEMVTYAPRTILWTQETLKEAREITSRRT